MWKVRYRHLKGYMVARTFKTLEEAEEFIHVNALVAPLPDMTLTEI